MSFLHSKSPGLVWTN